MAAQTNRIPTFNEDMVLPYSEILTESERAQLAEFSNVVRYDKKDVIFLQNTRTSHMMFLKSGLVKIYKTARNRKAIILKLVTPGNYLGLMSVFGSDIHQYSGSVVEPAEIYYIDINAFRNVLMQNGKYGLKVIGKLSTDGLYIFDRLMAQSHKQLPGRIADVILYFSEVIYKNTIFTFPLTRRELAELAGTTKESFIRTLTEFKNDKIIHLDGSHVEIVSMKIIKTLSELG
jgi:CRP/FNR family transcriptional regulator, polysaccharide utilization system transcription regulator